MSCRHGSVVTSGFILQMPLLRLESTEVKEETDVAAENSDHKPEELSDPAVCQSEVPPKEEVAEDGNDENAMVKNEPEEDQGLLSLSLQTNVHASLLCVYIMLLVVLTLCLLYFSLLGRA